jgi:hypothetical protein
MLSLSAALQAGFSHIFQFSKPAEMFQSCSKINSYKEYNQCACEKQMLLTSEPKIFYNS